MMRVPPAGGVNFFLTIDAPQQHGKLLINITQVYKNKPKTQSV